MRKIFIVIMMITMLGINKIDLFALPKADIINSLTSIDPEILKYFPRWKICETDLQNQIKLSFLLLGKDSTKLSNDIVVIAAPVDYKAKPVEKSFKLLYLSCGEESISSFEIENKYSRELVSYISGKAAFNNNTIESDDPYLRRDYCLIDIPPSNPTSNSQTQAIVNFLEPNNVNHSFSMSLFDQSLKLGKTDFWIRSSIGTDYIGYHFWESGESRVILKRPLYKNTDAETSDRIPNLIDAYLGYGFRLTMGLNGNSSLNWITKRLLNAGPGGKLVGGFDFYMPFHPVAGVHFNVEVPLKSLANEPAIEESDYGIISVDPNDVYFNQYSPHIGNDINKVAPLLRATAQFSLFYNLWINKAKPENYLRFDLGMTYSEVREVAVYREKPAEISYLVYDNVDGLKTYKPEEFGDWLYLKAEFRNQATYPFGLSIQYANQMLLARVYLPILGDWLYVEGKYSTPLRGKRYYEIENFFMISPVIRLTI